MLRLEDGWLRATREGDKVASGLRAMPRHLRLFVEDAGVLFGPLAPTLDGHKHHSCQLGRHANKPDGGHLLLANALQAVARPHVVGVAQGRQAPSLQVGGAVQRGARQWSQSIPFRRAFFLEGLADAVLTNGRRI